MLRNGSVPNYHTSAPVRSKKLNGTQHSPTFLLPPPKAAVDLHPHHPEVTDLDAVRRLTWLRVVSAEDSLRDGQQGLGRRWQEEAERCETPLFSPGWAERYRNGQRRVKVFPK